MVIHTLSHLIYLAFCQPFRVLFYSNFLPPQISFNAEVPVDYHETHHSNKYRDMVENRISITCGGGGGGGCDAGTD